MPLSPNFQSDAYRIRSTGLAVCKKAELHTTVPAFPPALIPHDPLRHRECSTTSSSTTHNVIMNRGAIGETVLLWLQLSQRIRP